MNTIKDFVAFQLLREQQQKNYKEKREKLKQINKEKSKLLKNGN